MTGGSYRGTYVVFSPEAARQRALAGARARLATARRRLSALGERHLDLRVVYGDLGPLPPSEIEAELAPTAGITAITKAVDRCEGAAERLSSALDAGVRARRRRLVDEALRAAIGDLASSPPAGAEEPPPPDQLEARRSAVEGVLGRLAVEATPAVADALLRRGSAVVAECDSARARRSLVSLSNEVDRASGEARGSVARRQGLDAVAAMLAAWSGAAVTQATLEVDHARHDGTVALRAVEQTALAAVEHARQAADRDHVARATSSLLGQIGYEPEPGFEALVARDGTALAWRADGVDHRIRVRIDLAQRQLRLDPFTPDGEGSAADAVWREARSGLETSYRQAGIGITPQS